MNKQAFLVAVNGSEWATIDELCDMCLDAEDVFSEDDWEQARRNYMKTRIRREMKRLKDESGFPLFASVHTTDPATGKPRRVYKQEALFDVKDYHAVIEEYAGRVKHDYEMMKGYKERCEMRFSEQLRLPIHVESMLVGT
jgi:hypothetical protein